MENSFNIKEIANGVSVCSYKTNRFKTGRISFNIAVPLGKDASANAILPYILNRSCGKYPDFSKLNARLAELYGAALIPSVSKIGEVQVVRLSITMIDDRFAFDNESVYQQCAELLCDLIFEANAENGSFNEAEVNREKRLLLERIESEKNDKRVYALRRCEEIMCEDEPYGINCYGDAKGVESLTPQSVFDAWQDLLKKGVVQVNIVGNADVDEICELVKNRFAKIPRDEISSINTKTICSAKEVKKINEQLPINQGKLVIGYRAGITEQDENFGAVRVMADIFGGAPYSKLFVNVREKMSLCYYCSARLYRQKGIIMVQSGIENENEEKAITEINNQLKLLQNGEFTQSELLASIAGLKDTLMRVSDTPEDIDAWGYSQMTAKDFQSPMDIVTEIENVQPHQVIEAAKKVTLDTIYMLSAEEEEENE
ncbi:MAG: insulinase family protein [Clostridia bacterium]|nr:insulinase family protein [Clostridia bacterium]